MGREVMRVPAGFDWPIGRIWPGKMLSICGDMERYIAKDLSMEDRCKLCHKYAALAGYGIGSHCPELPFQDPPKGDWFQVWETTSEGSPISPAFEKPEELARWLADNNASAFGSQGATYDQWLKFIGVGWAPSAASCGGALQSGVAAIAEQEAHRAPEPLPEM